MKSLTRTLVLSAAAAGVALSLGTTAASAKIYKLTAGSSHPPIIPWVAVIKNHVVPQSAARTAAMGKGDSIQWTEAYAGVALQLQEHARRRPERPGRCRLGRHPVGAGQNAADERLVLRAFRATGDLQTLITRSVRELHKDVPAMHKAWDKHNQVDARASRLR